ncbi:hypothetical protein AgCh_022976 [Apium graveolens]
MLLAYACYKKIKLHQMDVKSAFLIGFMEEEVYVKQPPGFEHEQHPDYVCKLKKALYGLMQNGNDILIVEIYVDDIIFGSTNDSICQWFSKCMSSEFDMSMMGELNYFLGLQIKQSKDDIYVHQSKYVKNLLTRFGFEHVKSKSTPMNQNNRADFRTISLQNPLAKQDFLPFEENLSCAVYNGKLSLEIW